MDRRLTLLLGVFLGLLAVAFFVWVPTYPNYDAYYHLVWGRELIDGVTPSFDAYQAPTEHPLYLALAVLLQPFGESADRVLVLITLLSLAALLVGVFRLADRVFGRLSALAALLFVASSFAFLLYAVRAYLDVPFLALVVWAAVLEVERPRRGVAPMVLLAFAGLLRPEAWVLAAAYWAYCFFGSSTRQRFGLGLLVVAAPLTWFLVDWLVTGDSLFSLHSTSELAGELGRKRGLGNVPAVLVSSLAGTIRPPVALLGVLGVGLAWWRLGWRQLVIPLALLLSGIVVFVGVGMFGLALIPRYLGLSALALALFAGFALGGFSREDGALRGRWRTSAIAAACLGLVFVVWQLPSLARLSDELRFVGKSHDDLATVLKSPQVETSLRCGPLTFPNYRLVPDARWMLDMSREQVGARSARQREYGVAIFVLSQKALKRFAFADGASPLTNAPTNNFTPLTRHGYFVAYKSCP